MSTPFVVFLRFFSLPLLLIAGYLILFGKPGGHQERLDALVAPHVRNLMQHLNGLNETATTVPTANARFTSGRTLSGGGFIRP